MAVAKSSTHLGNKCREFISIIFLGRPICIVPVALLGTRRARWPDRQSLKSEVSCWEEVPLPVATWSAHLKSHICIFGALEEICILGGEYPNIIVRGQEEVALESGPSEVKSMNDDDTAK